MRWPHIPLPNITDIEGHWRDNKKTSYAKEVRVVSKYKKFKTYSVPFYSKLTFVLFLYRKNYPELENFLIENREKYLRHSAMNYTIQQKQYNNQLTERLLEVSAKHNSVFDENDFNFVPVRESIRCYYKSYVQSSKKRGIIVGYGTQQKNKKRKQKEENEETHKTGNVGKGCTEEEE